MSLGGALSTATTGLRLTQNALDITAQNVANADTPGYTRKSTTQVSVISGEEIVGVRTAGLSRSASSLVQSQLLGDLSQLGYLNTETNALDRIDAAFGAPGGSNALDTLYNNFTSSLQTLQTSPESISAQTAVLNDAATLTQRLNGLTDTVQGLRLEAENNISDQVNRVNTLLQDLETQNSQIVAFSANGTEPVQLLDQRDTTLQELSTLIDIRTLDRDNGGIAVFTNSGALLFDFDAASLDFDQRGLLSAETVYSSDPAERGVGTIVLKSPNGFEVDMIQEGAFRSGSIAANIELRDTTLVETQNQLDSLAASMAQALTNTGTTDGTAATVGAATGFDLDLTSLQNGDPISVTVTNDTTGVSTNYTFIRVDDAATLPLSDTDTLRTDDTVVGINFSGTMANVATQIGTALGAAFTVSNPAGSTIRIVDDGAAATSTVNSASFSATTTVLQDNGLGFPFFVDGGRSPNTFTNSLDGTPQRVGFAGRIEVNSALISDPSLLVASSTTPPTAAGDNARPAFMLEQLTSVSQSIDASGVVGSAAEFSGTVSGYLQQVVSYQSGQAAEVEIAATTQQQIVTSLQTRLIEETGVNVDQEIARLIELENAFSANARVVQAIQELFDVLRSI